MKNHSFHYQKEFPTKLTDGNPFPVSIVIPTADRSDILRITLNSILRQDLHPSEIIVIDASNNDATFNLCHEKFSNFSGNIFHYRAKAKGAAVQRNQGCNLAAFPFILFCDDDIELEPFCFERMWKCLNSVERVGGVNAMITNQKYSPPGKLTWSVARFVGGKKLDTMAGRCLGPAWNFLPEDDENLPDCVQTDWLNTTCTLYRKEALPDPVFPENFKGYSLMEDLTLSLTVSKKWKVLNARSARIYHNSQPGDHKKSLYDLSKMELKNRHYVMTKVLEKRSVKDYCKLIFLESFFISAGLNSFSGVKQLPSVLAGKLVGIFSILRGK